jgi:hypothetical protein
MRFNRAASYKTWSSKSVHSARGLPEAARPGRANPSGSARSGAAGRDYQSVNLERTAQRSAAAIAGGRKAAWNHAAAQPRSQCSMIVHQGQGANSRSLGPLSEEEDDGHGAGGSSFCPQRQAQPALVEESHGRPQQRAVVACPPARIDVQQQTAGPAGAAGPALLDGHAQAGAASGPSGIARAVSKTRHFVAVALNRMISSAVVIVYGRSRPHRPCSLIGEQGATI